MTNQTTNALNFLDKALDSTSVGPYWERLSPLLHVVIILALAFVAHLLIKALRHASESLIRKSHEKKRGSPHKQEIPKLVTLTRLAVSAITVLIYFFTVGLIFITVFHFNDNFLKTYLSSAAVIGLALSFGLQGLVQDVVTGVTLIVSNAIDVGDIVDLSGTLGRVEQIGLRFTKVINFSNQEIFVPNRNIGNVARFPKDGLYAYADVQLSRELDSANAENLVRDVAKGVWGQFGAIILEEPEIGKIEASTPGGWNYVRIQFVVWPGQQVIETIFRPQMVSAMKKLDPDYADWMVVVTYRAIASTKDKSKLGDGMRKVSLDPTPTTDKF